MERHLIVNSVHNSSRSQIAEAFLRKYAGNIYDAYSAGFDPKAISPYAIKAMEEIGYDISNQWPKDLRQLTRNKFFAVAITVCKKAEEEGCPTILGAGARLNCRIDNPENLEISQEEKLAKFREVRDQIQELVKSFLSQKGIVIHNGMTSGTAKRKEKRTTDN